MTTATLPPTAFASPAILLSGAMDQLMYRDFRSQLDQASDRSLVVVALSTLGGDPEVARTMGEDIRFHQATAPERRFVFLGRAMVYSAGTTFMSFFPREDRYLTPNSRLMIHERKLSKDLKLEGPLTSCIAVVKAALNEIECSIELQDEGFASLVRGSCVSMNEVLRRAPSNWYIEAEEAKALGLIEGVI